MKEGDIVHFSYGGEVEGVITVAEKTSELVKVKVTRILTDGQMGNYKVGETYSQWAMDLTVVQ